MSELWIRTYIPATFPIARFPRFWWELRTKAALFLLGFVSTSCLIIPDTLPIILYTWRKGWKSSFSPLKRFKLQNLVTVTLSCGRLAEMPAMEYSRGTAGNIFTRFHIMVFLYDDLKVINVSINYRFKSFYGLEL